MVPSVFSWKKPKDSSLTTPRHERSKSRAAKKLVFADLSHVGAIETVYDEPSGSSTTTGLEEDNITEPQCKNVLTQTTSIHRKLSIEELSLNSKMLHYYTGLEDYDCFQFALSTLGPNRFRLIYRGTVPTISIENQFLVVLLRLRRYMSYLEISYLMSISEKVVSSIIITWINFMYIKWSTLDLWPSKDLVQFYSPEDFHAMFPSTRVILDGVEIPVKKPSNPRLQQLTWSQYKNRNTLKSVPGVTPGGLVSWIPPASGGSCSDRIFVERGPLPQMCDPKDSVMVDKGFDVQDIFATKDVTVNIPTFLKNGNQFSVTALDRNRKIASKRVHVERIIGLAKTYRILERPLNDIETVLGNRIVYCCFMLCNMRSCMVPSDA